MIMKRTYNIALLSVAALLASCQAEPQTMEPSTNVDGEEKIVISASTQVDSKVGFAEETAQIALTWAEGDAFTIYDESGARIGDFTYIGEDGLTTGDFVDDFETGVTLTDGATYTAVMPASDSSTLDERNSALEGGILNQSIDSVDALDYLNDVVSMTTSFTYSASEGNAVTFAHEKSLIKLSLAMDIGISPATIKFVDGGNSDATYTVTLPTDCPRSISVYFAVEPREVSAAADLTFTVDDDVAYTQTISSAVNFVAGHYHEVSISFVTVGWTQDYVNELSIPAATNATLGILGDNLIVSTASAQYVVDIETGVSLGEASWSMDLGSYGAITSDAGGNLLLASGADADATYTIYTTSSIDVAPVEIVSLSNPYGAAFGKKISVYGDITGDAVITVPLWYGANTSGFMFVRWVVTGGVIGEAEKITASGVTPDSWNGNMDVCYATTDTTSGMYYTVAYSANEISAVNAADDTLAGSVSGTLLNANSNVNCVDVVDVNGSQYVATFTGAFFSYSSLPQAYVYDVTSVASYPLTTVFCEGGSRYNSGSAASGDIIMRANGSNLDIFFIDGYDGIVAYYQFAPEN